MRSWPSVTCAWRDTGTPHSPRLTESLLLGVLGGLRVAGSPNSCFSLLSYEIAPEGIPRLANRPRLTFAYCFFALGRITLIETKRRSKSWANQQPARPPSTPRSKLSVSAWRMRRPRVAPSAVRTANSGIRLVALGGAGLLRGTRDEAPARTAPRKDPRGARASWICRSRSEAYAERHLVTNWGNVIKRLLEERLHRGRCLLDGYAGLSAQRSSK